MSPWETLPGTSPGLEPIIKQVKEAANCENKLAEALEELINTTAADPTLMITAVVGQAVYENISDEYTVHLEKNNIRVLRSKHLRYDYIVVM